MASVAGYELDFERSYDPDTDLWVAQRGGGQVRVGLDPLGAEIMGDIVAISFTEVGTCLERGDAFATLEAAKFVGPVIAPVRGTLVAVNEDAITAPGGINSDPFGTWLVELEDVDSAEVSRLLSNEHEVTEWFTAAVERFRSEGAIAE